MDDENIYEVKQDNNFETIKKELLARKYYRYS